MFLFVFFILNLVLVQAHFDYDNLWDVVIKTCDRSGAGTDADVYIKIYYDQKHTSETFELDTEDHDDFERGKRDHYKLALKQNDIINLGLYWWPNITLREHWCVDWVILLNSALDQCIIGTYGKWILHYRDPPTYPEKFKKMKYADCINMKENY